MQVNVKSLLIPFSFCSFISTGMSYPSPSVCHQGVKSDVRTSSGMFLSHEERKYPMIQVGLAQCNAKSSFSSLQLCWLGSASTNRGSAAALICTFHFPPFLVQLGNWEAHLSFCSSASRKWRAHSSLEVRDVHVHWWHFLMLEVLKTDMGQYQG